MPTNNLIQFENMVNKVIKYESSSLNFTNDILLIAHKDDPNYDPNQNFQKCCERVVYYSKQNYYNIPITIHTAYGNSIVDGGDNAKNADVVSLINSGMNLVTYRGHGEDALWGYYWNASNENFYYNQIDSLDENSNSIFLSFACLTGNICAPIPSMLETFLHSNHGAVAFLGATESTNHDCNNSLMRNFFLQIYRYGTVIWGDLLSLTMTHNLRIVPSYYGKLNAYSYIFGGDPTLEIWTIHPRLFQDVSYELVSDSVLLRSDSIQDFMVSVVSEEGDCLACHMAEGGVCSFAKPMGNFYISILKHDYLPYVTYINFDTDIIQNRQIKYNEHYLRSPMNVGYDVSNNQPFGNVIVKSGGSLKISNANGTIIKNGFTCEEGATMTIE